MKIEHKKILLVSPEPWNHIFVSKHHYAIHLGQKNNQVFFLNPPTKSESILYSGYENVYSVNYKGFPRGLRFYPHFLQKYFLKKVFLNVQKIAGAEFDIIWSFDNSVFYDFSVLPKMIIKINHIVDLNQNFQTKIAASTADFCFCSTHLIKDRLSKFNTKVYFINHGYNYLETNQQLTALPGRSAIKVLYAGNLAMPFIDWALLLKITAEHREIDFIFIGPNGGKLPSAVNQKEAKDEVLKSSNAHFIGQVDADKLQSYYQAADVLLVAYQDAYHEDQANPHKMMEYLGSGKMIVATFTSEYTELKSQNLIQMSKRNEEFPSLFRKVVSELGKWNESGQVGLRKGYALSNSYYKQIGRIESIIFNNTLS